MILPFSVKSEDHSDTTDLINPTKMAIQNPIYKRLKLFPWWVRYNVGVTRESILKEKIVELAKGLGLDKAHAQRVIRHAISEFSKNGLGSDYYGYHNINHELEVTYYTLLAIIGLQKKYENRLDRKSTRL